MAYHYMRGLVEQDEEKYRQRINVTLIISCPSQLQEGAWSKDKNDCSRVDHRKKS